MGLMEREIQELRTMISRMDAGTIKPDEINAKVAVYSQIQKRADMILKASALALKHNGRNGLKMLTDSNLVGGPIQLESSPDEQIISCPDTGKAITRSQCLDYSGEQEHYESCMTCKNFQATRNMLCKE